MNIKEYGFIYLIISPSNRKYVGSTKNINRRFKQYKKLKCKSQRKLYNSFLKYGVDNHTFEVIWMGNINNMLKFETILGLCFKVLHKDSGLNLKLPSIGDKYNVTSEETRLKMSLASKSGSPETRKKISDGHIGIFPTEEHRQKLREKAKNRSYEHQEKISKAHRKPIIQYDKQMNFIREWDSIREASKELKINPGNIGTCCRKNEFSAGKFKWGYKTC